LGTPYAKATEVEKVGITFAKATVIEKLGRIIN
jgi:hypothetical protein